MSTSTQALTSCAKCGVAFPLGARFCPSCGTRMDASQPRVALPLRQTIDSETDPLIGQVIADRYRIAAILGRGGMGVVYRVEHVHIGKIMAMKLLSGELAHDPQMLKRFQREAQAVSKLGHPNTVQIFDFGSSDRLAYLVMEYLPGRDLATLIDEHGPLPFSRVAQIAAQIAASVGEAHQSGVIHRDIKPENVMILDSREQRDFVKVLDFGIAKLRDSEEGLATQRGHLLGTPHYMAPEQIRAEAMDHRVDIYALGGLMYKAVTGDTPFVGENPMEVLGKQLNEAPIPVRKRAPTLDIPEEAERIIGKALAKDPNRRYQSMAALREDLQRYLRSAGVASGTFDLEPDDVIGLRGDLATRGDVDGYERGIRRASRVGKAAGAVALLGICYAAYALFGQSQMPAALGVETEPNDDPATSNLLTPGQPIRGQIGKRKSTTEADPDVYRIEPRGAARVADIALTPLPNIDLALDLVEKGSPQPLLSVNSGEVGQPERIPNMLLRGDTYYLRVREVAVSGKYPTENVSDEYTLSLALSESAAGGETELNDSFELAEKLAPGVPVRGLLGWKKDRDVYCIAPSREAQRVKLSGIPELDLVLAYLDRSTDAGQKIDHNALGEGEQIELPASGTERTSCFTISAKQRDGAKLFDAETRYEIVLAPAS
jgi:eukaryotic-like serine/threonine-protein kinase